MSYFLDDMILIEKLIDEEQKALNRLALNEEDNDPLTQELASADTEEQETAFMVMQELMDKFKDFCDSCERAWKVQEIPAALRQRLISIDQHNQERYQKLYLLIQKYAEEMKGAAIRGPNNENSLPKFF